MVGSVLQFFILEYSGFFRVPVGSQRKVEVGAGKRDTLKTLLVKEGKETLK